jgi:hypothetical protein
VSGGRGALTVAVSVTLCCGLGWLLVAAGVVASSGLLSSPELTVAAVALAGWALIRLAVELRQLRAEERR